MTAVLFQAGDVKTLRSVRGGKIPNQSVAKKARAALSSASSASRRRRALNHGTAAMPWASRVHARPRLGKLWIVPTRVGFLAWGLYPGRVI